MTQQNNMKNQTGKTNGHFSSKLTGSTVVAEGLE